MGANYSSIGGTAGGLVGGPIGAGIGSLAGGLIGLIAGAGQKKKGRDLLNQPHPTYHIPGEITQAANEGLPSEQYAQAMKNIQRQQVAAQTSAQNLRAGLGMIGQSQQLSNDAGLSLDVANAQARQKNQRVLAQYKDKAWDWNVKDKYQRDYNYGMQLLGAGNQNTMFGLDKAGAGIGMLAGGGAFKGMFGGDSTIGSPRNLKISPYDGTDDDIGG